MNYFYLFYLIIGFIYSIACLYVGLKESKKFDFYGAPAIFLIVMLLWPIMTVIAIALNIKNSNKR